MTIMRATFAAMTKILGEDTPGVLSNAVQPLLYSHVLNFY